MTGDDLKATLAVRVRTAMIADVDSERNSIHAIKRISIGHRVIRAVGFGAGDLDVASMRTRIHANTPYKRPRRLEAGLFFLFENGVDENNGPEQKTKQPVRSFRKNEKYEGNNGSKDDIQYDTIAAVSKIVI